MKRRSYLAAAAIASASLSGCSMLGEDINVPSPSEERGPDMVRFTHEHDGEPVAQVSFATRPSAPSTRRVRTTVSQPAETAIERAEFQFSAQPAPDDSQFRTKSADNDLPVFVQPLRGHRSDRTEIYRTDGSTGIDGRDHGRGTVSYELLADFSTADGEVGSITVGYEIDLAERRRLTDTFTARHRATLSFE